MGGPDLGDGTSLTIGENAFSRAGENIAGNTIWIGETVISIAKGAFNNAYPNVTMAYFWHSYRAYGVESYDELGLHDGISVTQWQSENGEQWGED